MSHRQSSLPQPISPNILPISTSTSPLLPLSALPYTPHSTLHSQTLQNARTITHLETLILQERSKLQSLLSCQVPPSPTSSSSTLPPSKSPHSLSNSSPSISPIIPPSPPSHPEMAARGTHWSYIEKARFEAAVLKYGHFEWRDIISAVGTRSEKQVKAYAARYRRRKKMASNIQALPIITQSHPLYPTTNTQWRTSRRKDGFREGDGAIFKRKFGIRPHTANLQIREELEDVLGEIICEGDTTKGEDLQPYGISLGEEIPASSSAHPFGENEIEEEPDLFGNPHLREDDLGARARESSDLLIQEPLANPNSATAVANDPDLVNMLEEYPSNELVTTWSVSDACGIGC